MMLNLHAAVLCAALVLGILTPSVKAARGKQAAAPGRWELRRGFTQSAIDVLEEFAGEPLVNNLQTDLKRDGDMEDFILWLEDEQNLVPHVTRFWDYRVKLHDAGVMDHEINELEAWYVSKNDIKRLETNIGQPIPTNIRRSFANGDFQEFIQWIEDENIGVSSSGNVEAITRIFSRAGASSSLIARLESALQQGSGSSGLQGIRLSRTAVQSFQSAIGSKYRIPSNVKAQMNTGNFQAFADWYESSSAKITKRDWDNMQRDLRRSGLNTDELKALNVWFDGQGLDGDSLTGSSWASLKLSGSAVSELENTVRRKIPRGVKQKIESGDFAAFSEWVAQERITISEFQQRRLVNNLRRKTSSKNIGLIQTWLKETKGKGGKAKRKPKKEKKPKKSGNWGNIKLSRLSISEMEKQLELRIPSDVESEMTSGNFEAFIDWANDNNVQIDKRKWNVLMNSLYRRRRITKAQRNNLDGWFDQFGTGGTTGKSEEEEEEETDSKEDWESMTLSGRDIFQMRRILRLRIPKNVQGKMKNGDFGSFSSWISSSNTKISDKNFKNLISTFKKGGLGSTKISALENWYENEYKTGGKKKKGTKKGGKGGKGNKNWKKVKLTSTAIDELESGFGVRISSAMKRKLRRGDFEAFSKWIIKEKSDMTSDEFEDMIDSMKNQGVKASQTSALEEWYRSQYKVKTGSTKSGLGNLSQKTVSELRKKFRRMPFTVRTALNKGEMNALTTWMKKSRVELSRNEFDDLISKLERNSAPDEDIEALESWYEAEFGGSSAGKKSGEKNSVDLSLSRSNVDAIGRSLRISIPDDVADEVENGDIDALAVWMEDNDVKISSVQLRRIEFALKGQGLGNEEIMKLRKWHKSLGKTKGGSGGSSGSGSSKSWKKVKLTRRGVRSLEDALDTEMPSSVSRKILAGDFDAFAKWYAKSGITIPESRFETFIRSLRSQGVSSGDIRKLEAWYKSSGKSTSSGGGKIDARGIRSLEIFLKRRLPADVKNAVLDGDYAELVDWMESENVDVRDLSSLPPNFPDELVEELEAYKSGNSGSSGGGGGSSGDIRISSQGLSDIESDLLEGQYQIPSSIRREMSNGDIEGFFRWLKDEEILITEDALADLQANADSSDISDTLMSLIVEYEGSQRPVSVDAISEVELLTGDSIPDAVFDDLEDGVYRSFFEWLQSDDISFDDDSFEYFADNYDDWGVSNQFFAALKRYHELKGGSVGTGGGGGSTDIEELVEKFKADFIEGNVLPSRSIIEVDTDLVTIIDCDEFVRWLEDRRIQPDKDTWVWFADSYIDMGIGDECFTAIRTWYWSEVLYYPDWVIGMLEWAEASGDVDREKLDRLTIEFEDMDSLDEILKQLGLNYSKRRIQDFARLGQRG